MKEGDSMITISATECQRLQAGAPGLEVGVHPVMRAGPGGALVDTGDVTMTLVDYNKLRLANGQPIHEPPKPSWWARLWSRLTLSESVTMSESHYNELRRRAGRAG